LIRGAHQNRYAFSIVKLSRFAISPTFHKYGINLYAAYASHIAPYSSKVIKTDIQFNVPSGFCAIIRPRPDLALHYFIATVCGPIIDATFKDEITITLVNCSSSAFFVKPGNCVAQLNVYRMAIILENRPLQFGGRNS